MYLNDILAEKNMSRYRLSKESGVPQTTIADICNGKARLEKCTAETVYRIAQTINVTMESLIEKEIALQKSKNRTSFEVFKSNICHLVKDKGDIDFILEVLTEDTIRELYEKKWYVECFYTLAMVDYLSRKNSVPICTKYNEIRTRKMQETIYPASVILMDEIQKTDANKQESLKNAIPEFLKYNIVEDDIRDVC
ncbi:MAG: helix-turn-helix domain-containing protein [Eubacteriales bacterium]|nr:helix-turn-helix domain-containing protein [Eubacteriales bacterium]